MLTGNFQSFGFDAHATTLIRTSFGPGEGIGTSRTSVLSGWPATKTDFINAAIEVWLYTEPGGELNEVDMRDGNTGSVVEGKDYMQARPRDQTHRSHHPLHRSPVYQRRVVGGATMHLTHGRADATYPVTPDFQDCGTRTKDFVDQLPHPLSAFFQVVPESLEVIVVEITPISDYFSPPL